MPDISKLDLYCREAQSIIARSEEVVQDLKRSGACEGHRLMAGQCLVALGHLRRLIEGHRKRLILEAPSNVVSAPAPTKRRWWSAIWRRPGAEESAFEACT